METFAVNTLAALANETRLGIYRLLAAKGAEGMRPGEIATNFKVAPSTLSSHLAALTRAGIVSQERRGTAIIYRAQPERVKALARLLVEG